MPTYDYECQACNHTFERFQEITANKLRTCPECGKRKLHRLIGAGAGVIFRGSGFYETDYKRAARSGGKAAESSSEAKSDTGPKSDAKSSSTSTKSAPKKDAAK